MRALFATQHHAAAGAVVFYSIGGEHDTFFEVLADDLNVVGTLGMGDFIGLFKWAFATGAPP